MHPLPLSLSLVVSLLLVQAGRAETVLGKVFGSLPVSGGEVSARLVTSGPEAWAARWALLASAQESIDITYYTLSKDIFGFALLGRLLEAGERGVKVRLMVDRVGSIKNWSGFGRGQDIFEELAGKPGFEVVYYKTLSKGLGEFFKDGAVLSTGCGNHDKLMLVDGKWAILGGRNVSHEYYVSFQESPHAYVDKDLVLEGETLVSGLREAFEREFHHGPVTRVKPDHWNFKKRTKPLKTTARAMQRWLSEAPFDVETEEALRTQKSVRKQMASALLLALKEEDPEGTVDTNLVKGGLRELAGYPSLRGALTGNPEWSGVSGVPVQILDKTSMLGVPFDSLGSGRKTLMAAAQEEIVLQSPYLMLTEEGMQALQDAAERGVKVTVITNSPATGDSGTVQAHFLLFWREILARLPGGELKVFTGDLNLHAKAMVIDRRLVLMGSDNYDFFGSEVNGEVVTALDSSELAAQVLEAFQQDMSNPLTRTRPYLILRGADGEVVRIPPGEKDAGRPVSVYGPEDHTEKGRIDRFKSRAMKKLRSIKGFEALMQFPRHLLKD